MTDIDGAAAVQAARPADPSTPPVSPPPDRPRRSARRRVAKWDRPPPPHDWRWWAGNIGRAMIAVGLLMFAFVAYQLWGTGIETARAQRGLERDFEELLAAVPPPDPASSGTAVPDGAGDDRPTTAPDGTSEPADPSGTTDGSAVGTDEPDTDATDVDADRPGAGADDVSAAAVPVAAQRLPEVEEGQAIARIEIPAIGVDDIVVAGVSVSDLKKGPGHFPQTPLPGQLGNASIAGHRTTYGQPFFDVDELVAGDEILVTTLNGVFTYRVTGQRIVSPNAGEVVATSDPNTASLTLVSCHPKFTARQRIVVFSELDSDASPLVGEPVLNYGRPLREVVDSAAPGAPPPAPDDRLQAGVDGERAQPAPGGEPATEPPAGDAALLGSAAVTDVVADAFAEGWFSDPAANVHVLWWGLLLAAIGIVSYLLSRRVRRDWLGALVGIVPFLVTLYFFFQNVNRLLPPNL